MYQLSVSKFKKGCPRREDPCTLTRISCTGWVGGFMQLYWNPVYELGGRVPAPLYGNWCVSYVEGFLHPYRDLVYELRGRIYTPLEWSVWVRWEDPCTLTQELIFELGGRVPVPLHRNWCVNEVGGSMYPYTGKGVWAHTIADFTISHPFVILLLDWKENFRKLDFWKIGSLFEISDCRC